MKENIITAGIKICEITSERWEEKGRPSGGMKLFSKG